MESNNPYGTPQATGTVPVPSAGLRSVTIKRVDPASIAKVLGAIYAILGLIIGGVLFLFTAVGAGLNGAPGGVLGGLAAMLFLPLLYGAMGFIGGLLVAAIYNVVAGFVGGVRMDLEG